MTTDNADRQPSLSMSKDFLFLVPLLGSALAITYDVGFFSGIGLGFFTLFSLSEHIVFALAIFPLALLFALSCGLLIYFTDPIEKLLYETAKNSSPAKRKLFLLIDIAFTVLLIGGVAYMAYIVFIVPRLYLLGAGSLVGAVMFGIVAKSKSLLARAVFGCAGAVITAYVFGFAVAKAYLQPNSHRSETIITTKIGSEEDTLLIRSGDRGVLFFDNKTKQIILLRWDEIKQIGTVKTP